MSGFTRHRKSGQVLANFTGFEADLLRSLASQLVELLRDEQPETPAEPDPLAALFNFSGPVDEPLDPVLLRLFPTAYAEDPEAAGEFRRYTEPALREGKEHCARAVVEALEDGGLPPELEEDDLMIDVELAPDDAALWLRALNDLRLALATRLEIEEGDEDFWEALDEEDPRTHAHDIYEWLGYLQETLVAAITA
ncbi:DUF2017 domain-containing protein [Nocardioides gilvus]|uniref:DUF2017 domain-containing protein n=1 Tax=Nocardioides gilvus TaxID=1735589 RepID=UPI000D74298A|nr:DUF2017 domain-containing protein [Nocardioides gilvus]